MRLDDLALVGNCEHLALVDEPELRVARLRIQDERITQVWSPTLAAFVGCHGGQDLDASLPLGCCSWHRPVTSVVPRADANVSAGGFPSFMQSATVPCILPAFTATVRSVGTGAVKNPGKTSADRTIR